MRRIKFIAIHCTATLQNASVDSITRYWKEQLHWEQPGYHYLIKPSGRVIQLLEEEYPSNGVAGYNAASINVCYIGGILPDGSPVDNRTPEQKAAMFFLLQQLKERYPHAKIQGHRDFPDVQKACPCFDARTEYQTL